MKAECIVHKFINTQSLIVLKNDGHMEAYKLMESYISDINAGVLIEYVQGILRRDLESFSLAKAIYDGNFIQN